MRRSRKTNVAVTRVVNLRFIDPRQPVLRDPAAAAYTDCDYTHFEVTSAAWGVYCPQLPVNRFEESRVAIKYISDRTEGESTSVPTLASSWRRDSGKNAVLLPREIFTAHFNESASCEEP